MSSPPETNPFLAAALMYLSRGWAVIPLEPRGKRPLVSWEAFRSQLPSVETIKTWWAQWPDANIGVITGDISGIVVLDVDGDAGANSLATVPSIPPTVVCQTGRGRHYYFRHPGGAVHNAAGLKPGLDRRGDGGYVVAPPSIHESGTPYRWLALEDYRMAAAPAWLLETTARLSAPPSMRTPMPVGKGQFPGVLEGQRNDALTRLAGRYFRQGRGTEEVRALLVAANEKNRPPLPPREIDTIVRSIGEREARQRLDRRSGGVHAAGGAEADGNQVVRYVIQGGQLCRVKVMNDSLVEQPLCNFTAEIAEELLLDDGAQAGRYVVIKGALASGTPLPPARIAVTAFPTMAWVLEQWGMRAVIHAGSTAKDAVREAIQQLSPHRPAREVFTATGWREREGCWIFVTAGGVVGADGAEVDLERPLQNYQIPTVLDDPRGAMEASLRFLNLAPPITTLLFAAMYRAPLAAAVMPDVSVGLIGPSGSFKSTLAALALSHYGPFERTSLPASWTSTSNALERLAYLAKDVVLVIDDYAPSSFDVRELEAKAARLLRNQGNVSARSRLRADLSARPDYTPRGLLLFTGEQAPSGLSIVARTLIVEMHRGVVDVAQLSACQNEAQRYPHAHGGYVAWLAPRYPALKERLRLRFQQLRSELLRGAVHLRLPEAVAHLVLGLECGLEYATTCGACSEEMGQQLLARGIDDLQQLAAGQAHRVVEERPARRFLMALQTLFAQGKVYVESLETESARRYDDATNGDARTPNAELIGWERDGFYYLLPAAALAAVVRLCRDLGDPFPVKERALYRDLAEAQLIVPTLDRSTTTIRVSGVTHRVLKLKATALDATFSSVPPIGDSGDSGDADA